MENFKNVIFDLGGVIMNLDFNKTFEAFYKLSGQNFSEVFSKSTQFQFVSEYEIGNISSADFRESIRKTLLIDADNATIDAAWNAMLLGFPKENIDFLIEVGSNKRTFILSNTNDIHKRAADKMLTDVYKDLHWDKMVERAYFSHIMKDRKPNTSIFETVLSENNLLAKETLFIDDSPQHIAAANKVGINAIHLNDDMSVLDLGII